MTVFQIFREFRLFIVHLFFMLSDFWLFYLGILKKKRREKESLSPLKAKSLCNIKIKDGLKIERGKYKRMKSQRTGVKFTCQWKWRALSTMSIKVRCNTPSGGWAQDTTGLNTFEAFSVKIQYVKQERGGFWK